MLRLRSILAFCILALSAGSAIAGEPFVLYSELTPAQKSLFAKYRNHLSHSRPSSLTDEECWRKTLPSSSRTTFAAITNALERTPLRGGRSAITLVADVTEINGEISGAASYAQFNVAVVWNAGAYGDFMMSGFDTRTGWGHAHEKGLSLHGRSTGLHVLFAQKSGGAGHVHVDYRKGGLLDVFGAGEGHFHAYNADVRAVGPQKDRLGHLINNYERHLAWF